MSQSERFNLKDFIRATYAAGGYTVQFHDEIVVSDSDIESVIKKSTICDYERAKKALQSCDNDIEEAVKEIERQNHNNAVFAARK